MEQILIAMAIVGGTGVFIGIFLGLAGKKFAVEVDEKEVAVLDALPGNNCGGCGYAGCSGLAAAIAKGEAPVNACPVGGDPVANNIAAIMGTDAGGSQKMVAFVKCSGTCEKAQNAYKYTGIERCSDVDFMQNRGPKACDQGCNGFGDCVRACPFDAIHVIDGIAVVDREACKACGKCVAACPKQMIEIIPYDNKYRVQCNSTHNGKEVNAVCKAGCIGCKLCTKECHFEAIHVEQNLAHIDYDLCKNCGLCAKKCPKKVITKIPDAPKKKAEQSA